MIKIFHVSQDDFKAEITLPRFMNQEYGQKLVVPFQIQEDRRCRHSSLLYALEKQKPITVQIFRREHKSDQWYIHLTTYVQEVPVTTTPLSVYWRSLFLLRLAIPLSKLKTNKS